MPALCRANSDRGECQLRNGWSVGVLGADQRLGVRFMGKRISDWLRGISTGWVALSALLLFLLFTALVLPQQATKSEQETGSADSPDTSFFYSPRDLYQRLRNRFVEAVHYAA